MSRLEMEQAVSDLTPVLNVAYDAIEEGNIQARDYIESRKVGFEGDRDGHSHAQRLRDHVLDVLTQAPLQPRLVIERLPNSGIAIIQEVYRIRITKAWKGGVHPPNISRMRRLALKQRLPRQQPLSPENVFGLHQAFAPAHVQHELSLIWTTNNLMEMLRIELVYTRDATRYAVAEEWRYPVPHPLSRGVPVPILPASRSLFDDGDADFRLADPEAQSGEHS